MTNDRELLGRYTNTGSEEAFAELVRRHLDLIYASALRQTLGSEVRAKEATQMVFCVLARKAESLRNHTSLCGWLHSTLRHTLADMRKSDIRRLRRETEALAMQDSTNDAREQANWEHLRPILDEVIQKLRREEREAVLLRYLEDLPFAEVGARLAVGEDAARMRVNRGIERIREILGKKGIRSTAGALAAVLSREAGLAAPVGLAEAVASAAITAKATAGLGIFGTLYLMKLANVTIGVVSAALGVGFGVWADQHWGPEAKNVAHLVGENERLEHRLRAAVEREAIQKARALPESSGILMSGLEGRVRAITLGERIPAQADPRALSNARQLRGALSSFTFAQDTGDTATLSRLITFGGDGRREAEKIWSTLPEAARKEYPTPESLYALFLADDAITAPPPPQEILDSAVERHIDPDHVALVFPNQASVLFERSADGWKYVISPQAVDDLAGQILAGSPPKS
jgi:RNA polymerase sigma factor (sigma-70 family)